MSLPTVDTHGRMGACRPGRTLSRAARAVLAVVPRMVRGRAVHAPWLPLTRGDDVSDTAAPSALQEGLWWLVLAQPQPFPEDEQLWALKHSPFDLAHHVNDGEGEVRGPGVVSEDILIGGQVSHERKFDILENSVVS